MFHLGIRGTSETIDISGDPGPGRAWGQDCRMLPIPWQAVPLRWAAHPTHPIRGMSPLPTFWRPRKAEQHVPNLLKTFERAQGGPKSTHFWFHGGFLRAKEAFPAFRKLSKGLKMSNPVLSVKPELFIFQLFKDFRRPLEGLGGSMHGMAL